MRLPPFRFSLRGLMFAVAISGSLLGSGLALWRRNIQFERLARHHGATQSNYGIQMLLFNYTHDDATCASFKQNEHPPSPNGQHDHFVCLETKHDRRWSNYHSDLAEKYGAAARRPWLPVAPDPPPPPGPEEPDN